MTVSIVLALFAIICALGSIFTGVRMAYELRARGIPANPALVRWMIFKYMAEYRRMTLKETGRVGPLYYMCANISALAAIFRHRRDHRNDVVSISSFLEHLPVFGTATSFIRGFFGGISVVAFCVAIFVLVRSTRTSQE